MWNKSQNWLRDRYGVYAVWGFAATLLATSAGQVAQLSQHIVQQVQVVATPLATVQLTETAAAKSEYESAAKRLGYLHPDLSFKAAADGITVIATAKESYSEFVQALLDTTLSIPAARWEIGSLCAGERCGQSPYRAYLKARFQSVKVIHQDEQ